MTTQAQQESERITQEIVRRVDNGESCEDIGRDFSMLGVEVQQVYAYAMGFGDDMSYALGMFPQSIRP